MSVSREGEAAGLRDQTPFREVLCLRLRTTGPEETRRLGEWLGRSLRAGDVLALSGELGTGKTCFVQGVGAALGFNCITSPTFTIIQEYPGDPSLIHIDAYRLTDPEEALALGIEEYLPGEGVTVVEWAERIGELLPPDYLEIGLETSPAWPPQERRLTLTAHGERFGWLLTTLVEGREDAFSHGNLHHDWERGPGGPRPAGGRVYTEY